MRRHLPVAMGPARVQRDTARAPRLIIVSYMANAPFSPRGIRTQELFKALQRQWSIELIAGPSERLARAADVHVGRSRFRKVLRLAYALIMFDKFEPWSRRRFRSWRPDAESALLIGFPFSPLVYASRRLAERGIPYVVDAGDPWVLTAARPELYGLGRFRGRKAEHRLWAGAAGAVVTTDAQARALNAVFPNLQILIRPNGFTPADQSLKLEIRPPSRGSKSILRLAHFGEISYDRVNIGALLQDLARSGVWSAIEFHQYGSDWTGALRKMNDVTVKFHKPRPWQEILALATGYDLALVIGNRDPMLLPSKTVVYLQLPIPRIAVVDDDANNALAQYVLGKPGWIVVRADGEGGGAETIQRHLSREWTAAELAAPTTESWARVSSGVGEFLEAVLNNRVLAPCAADI